MQLPTLSRPLAVVGAFFLVMVLLNLVSLKLGERTARQRSQVIDITMSTAEHGGFAPTSLQLQAGRPVTLRFHASDVAHALAIGPGLDIDLGVIALGETKEVTLTFDRPGVYTFYCNLWCSPEHWRMRGVIDVVDADGNLPPAAGDPVIAALTAAGIDIDGNHAMAHTAEGPLHDAAPDAAALASMEVGAELRTVDWQRTHTLAEAVTALGAANPTRTAAESAGAAAALWMEQAQVADLTAAGDLYAKNCAACHGAQGRGDGPAAALAPTAPPAFTVAGFSAMRRDVLYAKIRRGGMGTGMPNFGTLFTPEETWLLVDYLWQLAFGDHEPAPHQ